MNKPVHEILDTNVIRFPGHPPATREPGKPTLAIAAFRGVKGRCPQCGQGKLFRAYLKQVDRCAVCGEEYGHIRSDDAAPWLTILIVGHLVVPLALAVETHASVPSWVSMSLWPSVRHWLCCHAPKACS
jgi:uncharacterized protein (DUF983 family)